MTCEHCTELRRALEGLESMYARTWDRVDGSLVMFPDSIPLFEEAHRNARVALGIPLVGDLDSDKAKGGLP